MAQQVTSTIDRPMPRHSVTERPGGRRPRTRRPEGARPARGPQLQRSDRGFGLEARGVTASCRVQHPAARISGQRPGQAHRPAAEGMRLTDRGIAVVLTLGALLGLVAVFCIVITGIRVTAEPPATQAAPVAQAAQAAPAAAAPGAPAGPTRG